MTDFDAEGSKGFVKHECFRSGQESGDDEYKGDQSDTEDEVDSDFDIDEGDEPDSDQEDDEPRRKRRVVTKAYRVRGLAGPPHSLTSLTFGGDHLFILHYAYPELFAMHVHASVNTGANEHSETQTQEDIRAAQKG